MGLTLIFLCFFHLVPPEIGFCLQLYPIWLSLFSTTSPASPRLGQTSSFPCSFPLVLVPRWKQLVYGAASTSAPMGAFHAFSSLKQMVPKLVPSNSSHECCTPQTAPLALLPFLPFPSSSPQALCAAGWQQRWLSLVQRREGRSSAWLQRRQQLVQAALVGASCSSPDSFCRISTPCRTCSGCARDFASACF